MDEGWFAGAVTLVARDDRIVHFQAQGLMEIEPERPMQTDAVFRIMSMTKPVVAVSILMLMEEGRLRLSDPVSRFVPQLGDLSVTVPGSGETPGFEPAAREVTLVDLLTHTAGLMVTGATNSADVTIGPDDALADVIPRLEDAPLEFQPGTRWAYSGQFGFDVLAHVVELASGMSFDAFTRQRIFEPLGMMDTFFFPPEGHPRIAALYASTDGRLAPQAELEFVNGGYFSGGGGLFSTAEDYFRFASMLLHDGALGGTRLVSRKTLELMRSAFIPSSLPGRTPGEGYGLGVRVVTDRAARQTLLSNGSFGWSGAFNTHFFIDPDEKIVGIFMTQSAFLATRQQLRDDFETAVMQALVDDADSP